MTEIYAPGPWTIKGASIQAIDHGIRFTIARVSNPKLSQAGIEGTAQLMASAPDLLSAAQSALDNLLPLYSSDHFVITSLKAAIKKATK